MECGILEESVPLTVGDVLLEGEEDADDENGEEDSYDEYDDEEDDDDYY